MVQKNSRRRLDRTFPVQQRSCFRGTQDRVCSSRKCIFFWSLGWRSIQRPAGLSNEHSFGRGGRRMSDHGCWRRGSGVGCQLSACRASSSAGGEYRAATVGSGRGPVHGTRVHTEFARQVQQISKGKLHTEVAYRNGVRVNRNTPGSVRVDAVRGNPDRPKEIWDLKTGSARLTPERIQQIRRHLPKEMPKHTYS